MSVSTEIDNILGPDYEPNEQDKRDEQDENARLCKMAEQVAKWNIRNAPESRKKLLDAEQEHWIEEYGYGIGGWDLQTVMENPVLDLDPIAWNEFYEIFIPADDCLEALAALLNSDAYEKMCNSVLPRYGDDANWLGSIAFNGKPMISKHTKDTKFTVEIEKDNDYDHFKLLRATQDIALLGQIKSYIFSWDYERIKNDLHDDNYISPLHVNELEKLFNNPVEWLDKTLAYFMFWRTKMVFYKDEDGIMCCSWLWLDHDESAENIQAYEEAIKQPGAVETTGFMLFGHSLAC